MRDSIEQKKAIALYVRLIRKAFPKSAMEQRPNIIGWHIVWNRTRTPNPHQFDFEIYSKTQLAAEQICVLLVQFIANTYPSHWKVACYNCIQHWHYHACQECFKHVPCTMRCTLNWDSAEEIFLHKKKNARRHVIPFGAHILCAECKALRGPDSIHTAVATSDDSEMEKWRIHAEHYLSNGQEPIAATKYLFWREQHKKTWARIYEIQRLSF